MESKFPRYLLCSRVGVVHAVSQNMNMFSQYAEKRILTLEEMMAVGKKIGGYIMQQDDPHSPFFQLYDYSKGDQK